LSTYLLSTYFPRYRLVSELFFLFFSFFFFLFFSRSLGISCQLPTPSPTTFRYVAYLLSTYLPSFNRYQHHYYYYYKAWDGRRPQAIGSCTIPHSFLAGLRGVGRACFLVLFSQYVQARWAYITASRPYMSQMGLTCPLGLSSSTLLRSSPGSESGRW